MCFVLARELLPILLRGTKINQNPHGEENDRPSDLHFHALPLRLRDSVMSQGITRFTCDKRLFASKIRKQQNRHVNE